MRQCIWETEYCQQFHHYHQGGKYHSRQHSCKDVADDTSQRMPLSRVYSQDGALGTALFVADRAVSAFRQPWVQQPFFWVLPEAERGRAAATSNLLEGENSAYASAVTVFIEMHNAVLISHSSSIEALEGISKPQTARRQGCSRKGSKNQEIMAHASEIQETNRALVDMEGRVSSNTYGRSKEALEKTAKARQYRDVEIQSTETGVELVQPQQQLMVNASSREKALSAELDLVKVMPDRRLSEGFCLFNKGYRAQTEDRQSPVQRLNPRCRVPEAACTGPKAASNINSLADANAKVIEHQAHIDHLKQQRMSQLVETPTDALSGQQLERLRT
ncbi:hypothetical protein PAAG_01195 [Paracoccidioides lutzii Pb01]|uniref:Uncharacterized protein n=1 Tax=Paracoccidioides lutzii (strain ATCC MYA-826 / Pb01) TaxID=502779 RepID=C1GRQ0_PARBA|nr:hypothetical protein PAAG_01195 [Paracoccidioides lutzii Pb01]EEH38274.2 hypothetical protein PAAG_01195 [Paracoccidioides lutzii Pb01]